MATHPNVGGAVFVTLGCAAGNACKLPALTAKAGRLSELLNFHQVGGTSSSVAAGVKMASGMVETLRAQKRVTVPISSIVLGTKCGASDKTSFETCHPIVGAACDRLIDMGATVVLSEDNELYPAIDDLADRAEDGESKERLHRMVERLQANLKTRTGLDLAEMWGEQDQARLKSLAHAAKAGTRPIRRVVRLGDQVDAVGGLVVLDAPNSDLISMTSLAAAGCNLLAFTTGRGTPASSPVMPTIKITANERTYAVMQENTDLLVGTDDPSSVDRVVESVISHAGGLPTKGELLGHADMFIPLEGVTF